eukprot:GILK01005328.1.p1 GENE.GILK01005328.1~~GILK01005328.1.p1  ORF type:complete len:354 (+),score=54.25 GILK01005328.1:42-1103(+)
MKMRAGAFVLSLLLLSSLAQEDGWNYDDSSPEGPAYWDQVDRHCGCQGSVQAPINIAANVVIEAPTDANADTTSLPPPDPEPFHAMSLPLLSRISEYQPLSQYSVHHNGVELLVPFNASKGFINFKGTKFYLTQFHFHTPSENQFDYVSLDLEMHLVHKSADNRILVLAVLFHRGEENQALKPIWSHIPHKNSSTIVPAALNIFDFLPSDLSYFYFKGSLTTPPCSGPVDWLVLSHPVTVSDTQIQMYRDVIPLGHDNRPVQRLDGRDVLLQGTSGFVPLLESSTRQQLKWLRIALITVCSFFATFVLFAALIFYRIKKERGTFHMPLPTAQPLLIPQFAEGQMPVTNYNQIV